MKLLVLIGGDTLRGSKRALADADVAVAVWSEDHRQHQQIIKDRWGDTELTVLNARLAPRA